MTDSFGPVRSLFLGWDREEPFEAALKLQFGPSTHWPPLKFENPGMFLLETISLWLKK